MPYLDKKVGDESQTEAKRWYPTTSLLHPLDGGSEFLRNVGNLPHHYTTS